MLFVALAVLAGLAAGRLLGGSLRRLEATSLRRVKLVVLAVLAQLVGAFLTSGWPYAAVLVGSLLLAVVFLASNPTLAGRGLLGLGLAANALVIVANGAMPVELDAAARAGVQTGPLAGDPRHTLGGPGTRLSWFDDRIPLPLPLSPQVLSAGDVLVAAGAGLLITQAMRRRVAPPAPVRRASPTASLAPPRPPRPARSPGSPGGAGSLRPPGPPPANRPSGGVDGAGMPARPHYPARSSDRRDQANRA